MGIVKSTIYSTTTNEAMTQLEFSTDFGVSSANVTVNLVKNGKLTESKTYTLNDDTPVDITIGGSDNISSTGTITLAPNAIAFSGICVQGNVTSFFAQNIAIAYR